MLLSVYNLRLYEARSGLGLLSVYNLRLYEARSGLGRSQGLAGHERSESANPGVTRLTGPVRLSLSYYS